MWLDGFEQVTFPQSLGFPHRWPAIRGVCWHTTQGWRAEHAFNVYRDAAKGACPHVTVGYSEAFDGTTNRVDSKRRFQHVDTVLASYAVEHGDENGHACKVETNASGIVQIERVGFAADDVTTDELRWLGEQVLAPILAAHPEIPPWVYVGSRMTEDEWAIWAGGQCRHRDVCCQPQKHSDPGDLDLDVILHYALEHNTPPPPPPETDMIVLKVTDDPAFPSGVLLELSGNGIAWIQSGNLLDVYTQGGVKTVDVVKARVDDILLTKHGVGPSPSTVGSIVVW